MAMRNGLPTIKGRSAQPTSCHAGLAYDVYVHTDPETHKLPEGAQHDILAKVAEIPLPVGYDQAYERLQRSFTRDPHCRSAELISAGRLLVGHGNAAPTEIGLTLHPTWGTPYIPGSALKGLCAHYVETVYGADPAWRGVTWDGNRVAAPAGALYREMFGSPDVDGYKGQMLQGAVVFHDALCRYSSLGGPKVAGGRRFTQLLQPDVLTPHQSTYYRAQGVGAWPNDYDDPIPVNFLSVAPHVPFLFAVSGPEGWVDWAFRWLDEALTEWGVGGKTVAGYGRFFALDETEPGKAQAEAPAPPSAKAAPAAPLSPDEERAQAIFDGEGGEINRVKRERLTAEKGRIIAEEPEAVRRALRKLIRGSLVSGGQKKEARALADEIWPPEP